MGINASIRYFTTTDQLNLYYQHWIPESPKGLLIYVHDIGDHVGRHGLWVKYFLERGYGVAMFDQRGHGRSDHPKKNKAQFGEYVNDLSGFIHLSRAAVPQGTPIFLAGHGVGGQFAINLLVPAWNAVRSGFVMHPGKIKGFVALSPFIEPILRRPPWKLKLLERLVKFNPRFKMKGFLEGKDLYADSELAAAYEDDPLVTKKFPVLLQKQIWDNTQIIMAMASRIQIPVIMLHGGLDPVASPEGTRKFFSRLPCFPKKMHLYEEDLHELTNKDKGENILADMEAWLMEVCNTSRQDTIRLSKESVCGPSLFSF